MRRGLMAWDASELPIEALSARLARLREEMSRFGLDAVLLYTNFIRSAGVSWITAFSPYWADGMLLAPRVGEPVFATTLSNRVAKWVQSVKPVGELVHSPTPGVALGERLKKAGVRRLGVLELDDLPGGLSDELRSSAPGVEMVEGGPAFAAARLVLDDAEARLLARAQAIADEALSQAPPVAASGVGAVVAAVEARARTLGAEEIYIAVAPDLGRDLRFRRLCGPAPLGERFALRASVAYKGCWSRRIKSVSLDESETERWALVERWFANCADRLDPQRPLGPQIAELIEELPDSRVGFWLAESAVGTRPLAPVGGSREPDRPAAWAVVELRLGLPRGPWIGGRIAGDRRFAA